MGQYQNVPGPSQDEFNAQTQAIANKPDYATQMPMSTSDATKVSQAIGNIPKIQFSEGTFTTTGNANIDLSLPANTYNLLAVTVVSPVDYMAIPCLYSGYGNGILGAHIVSILNAMTPLQNTNVTVRYAYVKRS